MPHSPASNHWKWRFGIIPGVLFVLASSAQPTIERTPGRITAITPEIQAAVRAHTLTTNFLPARTVWANDKVLLPEKREDYTVVRRVEGVGDAVAVATTNHGGRTHAILATNEWNILRARQRPELPTMRTNLIVSPDVGVVALESGEMVKARLFMWLDDVPMPWEPRRMSYHTVARVGFTTEPESPGTELPAVTAHVQASHIRLEDTVNHVLKIKRPGLEGAVEIPLRADKYSPEANITVSTDVGEGNQWPVEITKLGVWDMITQIVPGPTLFLIALGGGLGGLLRSFKLKDPGAGQRIACVLEGLLTGLVVVSLVVGLGWKLPIGEAPTQVLTNPLALFGLAGVGGYGGVWLVERMVKGGSEAEKQESPA